jgi:NTP pyrophosphatase (non-canonical NTP hydrolase)
MRDRIPEEELKNYFTKAMDSTVTEYMEATKKFPWWPNDPFQGMSVVQEEVGEAFQALNDMVWKGKPIEDLEEELAQSAAMCIRMLQWCGYNKDKYDKLREKIDGTSKT